MKEILLTTINAKWIHPSLALRLLKANLGELEDKCEIIEFALRQPLQEKIEALSKVQPHILGISVSIWNHTATIELIKNLKEQWKLSNKKLHPAPCPLFPIIVLGGPEVSHLPQDAEIFKYTDFVIRGEGEVAFRQLCQKILAGENPKEKFIDAEDVDVLQIKTAYHLYTDEDIKQKLIYVESSRGCPFKCDFCMSSRGTFAFFECKDDAATQRDFNLVKFLSDIDILIKRGVKTFKFLDRTFNANIKRAIQICEFFLEFLEKTDSLRVSVPHFTVHFEIVPVLITPELIKIFSRFPPDTLRLEIGIQTLNPEVSQRINLPGRNVRHPGKTCEEVLEPVRLLCEKTNAIIHADLIAGLPGEDLESFAKGFDLLYSTLFGLIRFNSVQNIEIQLGILKQLPGTPISRHNDEFQMQYNSEPPYEVISTSAMSKEDIARLKNFARFWEVLINRGLLADLIDNNHKCINFSSFMQLSDSLYSHFGRNWGIDKHELRVATLEIIRKMRYI